MQNLPLIDIAALHVLIAQGKSVVLIDATVDKVNQRIDADNKTLRFKND